MSNRAFGIIGCGLIGRKRGLALKELNCVIKGVYDLDPKVASSLATELDSKAHRDSADLLSDPEIGSVVVATYHNSLAELTKRALHAGKHVLVEKPAGISPRELSELKECAESTKRVLRVGFNHRFHPAILKAKEILAEGSLGPLMYIRARYGHGGRVGYEKEWRAQPEVSGGGELVDQGSHLIDLSRWLGKKDFALNWGHAQTFFWDMPVEDNGFLFLQDKDEKCAAFLHASCSEWKNLFQFEIFCRFGKLFVTGLGRSYGKEELLVYRMQEEMGPPPMDTYTFPEEDSSWREEIHSFLHAIDGKPDQVALIEDAHASLSIIYDVYERSGYSWN